MRDVGHLVQAWGGDHRDLSIGIKGEAPQLQNIVPKPGRIVVECSRNILIETSSHDLFKNRGNVLNLRSDERISMQYMHLLGLALFVRRRRVQVEIKGVAGQPLVPKMERQNMSPLRKVRKIPLQLGDREEVERMGWVIHRRKLRSYGHGDCQDLDWISDVSE